MVQKKIKLLLKKEKKSIVNDVHIYDWYERNFWRQYFEICFQTSYLKSNIPSSSSKHLYCNQQETGETFHCGMARSLRTLRGQSISCHHPMSTGHADLMDPIRLHRKRVSISHLHIPFLPMPLNSRAIVIDVLIYNWYFLTGLCCFRLLE